MQNFSCCISQNAFLRECIENKTLLLTWRAHTFEVRFTRSCKIALEAWKRICLRENSAHSSTLFTRVRRATLSFNESRMRSKHHKNIYALAHHFQENLRIILCVKKLSLTPPLSTVSLWKECLMFIYLSNVNSSPVCIFYHKIFCIKLYLKLKKKCTRYTWIYHELKICLLD